MVDSESIRFTFEKCIFEAYMAFRGVGGKKPSEGRGDWAQRYLQSNDDPKALKELANKFHDDNIAYALYWTNNILGFSPTRYAEAISRYIRPDEAEEAYQDLDELTALKKQSILFDNLCHSFREMLAENDISVLPYLQVFQADDRWIEKMGIMPSGLANPCILDTFAKESIIPSEDFEIVFAASRICADIFVTDDNHLRKCALSLGTNSPLSPASFCRSNQYANKKQQCKSGLAFAEL
jgi:hypothetical protein